MVAVSLNFEPVNGANISADIAGQIRRMLLNGTLKSGDRLPSTRSLKRELAVARGTVVTALEILIAEGLLEARQGAGTFVSEHCQAASASESSSAALPVRRETIAPDIDKQFPGRLNFQACRPSLEEFPRSAWRRAAADAAGRLPLSDYGDPRGEQELRIAIASYLRRARGLDAQPGQIIVTNGATQAMHILARVYLGSKDRIAFEDPGYPLARQTFAMTGAEIVSVGVDDDGMRVEDLPEDGGKLKFVYVTPSHQFPTGRRLSLGRRKWLLEWACEHNVLILEDDYDGEFRYDVPPLPPMAAMSTCGSVVYFGTFSKTMFPGLRIGFAVAPCELIEEMAAYRSVSDYQTNTLSQLALATFIENGHFEKHVHRMRRVYARKRRALGDAIAEAKLPAVLSGTDSGINGLIRFNMDVSATDVSARAGQRDMCVTPISRYTSLKGPADDALVLGYGAPSIPEIEQGVRLLSRILKEAQR